MSYLNEKLYQTVSAMSVSEWPIRERLIDGYISGIHHAGPPVNDWGPEINTRLTELKEKLTKIEDPDNGSVHATVMAMTDQEVRDAVDEICGIIFLLGAPNK